MTNNTRPRDIILHLVPEARMADICGPFDRYALLERPDGEVRMVHYEGVAYLVTDNKPWTWNDYNPEVPTLAPFDLTSMRDEENWDPVNLADWVKVFGARCENNFYLILDWYNEV